MLFAVEKEVDFVTRAWCDEVSYHMKRHPTFDFVVTDEITAKPCTCLNNLLYLVRYSVIPKLSISHIADHFAALN